MLVVLLSFFFQDSIPVYNQKDDILLEVIQRYELKYSESARDLKPPFAILIRKQKEGSFTVYYAQPALFLSGLVWGIDIPEYYLRYNGRLVLLYNKYQASLNKNLKMNLVQQFGKELLNDLDSFGNYDPTSFYFIKKTLDIAPDEYLEFDPKIYRFHAKGNQILKEQEISKWPDSLFNSRGYAYDKNGRIMYQDGVYDFNSLDNNPFEGQYHFNVSEYIGARCSLPDYRNLSVIVTIGKDGKPIDVQPFGRWPEDTFKQCAQVVLNMPPWPIGYVKGKPVKYRISVGLVP